MNVLGIIPARYASTRLPGKPLLEVFGKPIIQWVYERAHASKMLGDIVVATDDLRIFDAVREFGGKAVMTDPDHESGTSRCREIYQKMPDYDAYLNIQGDEPMINAVEINRLISAFKESDTDVGSLAAVISNQAELFDPNTVKVLFSRNEAIYFSRQAIPAVFNIPEELWMDHHTFFKHIGIYLYTKEALDAIGSMESSPLEKAEGLEQLRWMENGMVVGVWETNWDSFGIDTPEDLERVRKLKEIFIEQHG